MSKTLKTVAFLISGLALLYFGLEKKQNIANYRVNETTVTVIDLTQKNSDTTFLIIVGVLLILIGLFFAVSTSAAKPKRKSKDNLTRQEKNVVSLIEKGKTNKEIAIELSVSVSTVKTHVNNIYNKLGIKSREDLL